MSAQGVGAALKRSQETRRKLRMIGADHAGEREKDDFYPTPPELTRALMAVEYFEGAIWEPACGDGAISECLKKATYPVVSSDLVDRGYGDARIDFLMEHQLRAPNIVTNPPFKLAEMFWRHAIEMGPAKVAFCLRLTWLEGLERAALFAVYPPSRVWVCPWRPRMQRGRLATKSDKGGMLAFAWFVYEREHRGRTQLGWLPDTRRDDDWEREDAAANYTEFCRAMRERVEAQRG